MKHSIRVATDALSGRIYAGRVNKAGTAFLSVKADVTSDVLKAVIDFVRPDHSVEVHENNVPSYEITIRRIGPSKTEG